MVLILSTGRVEQRLVEIDTEISDDDLAALRSRVLRATVGERLRRRDGRLHALETAAPGDPQAATTALVAAALVDAMSDHRSEERVAVGGTANLARYGDSFDTAVRPLLEALEEHVVLLKLLGEATGGGTVTVRIGHEGPYQALVLDERRGDRLRAQRGRVGHPRHRRPDADGLPRHDGRGAGRRALRLADPRRGLTGA